MVSFASPSANLRRSTNLPCGSLIFFSTASVFHWYEVMIFQWISWLGLTDEAADYTSSCWYHQYFCLNCSCHLQVVDIYFCWYHDSHSALHVSALNDHHVGIFLMSAEFFSITLIINNWWFSIMMLIILIKAHQANLEWMISWLQRPVISTLSSIFSFSAWFWVICFFSRNSSSVLLV